eukprot:7907386-Ditylum_brightwellii.AAC.1
MWLHIATSKAVLAWAEEEEEGDPDEVNDCVAVCIAAVEEGFNFVKHANWYGADSVWWWVLLGVSSNLALEAEVYFAKMVESGVRGPQSGKRLAHGTEVLFHTSFLDWLMICSHDTTVDVFCKKLKEGDRVRDVVQGRGDLRQLVRGDGKSNGGMMVAGIKRTHALCGINAGSM